MRNPIRFIFFGSDQFSVEVLETLKEKGLMPTLVVTTPPRPAGRGMKLTEPSPKVWAENNHLQILQPVAFDDRTLPELAAAEVIVVGSYGEKLPKTVLTLPRFGILNLHPSLLPKYRGASPVEAAILGGERDWGITLILMDEKIDHGPIIAAHRVTVDIYSQSKREIKQALAREGGVLIQTVLPQWVLGKITPTLQDESAATYTKKISRDDGCIDLTDDPDLNFRKVRAYEGWPGTYFSHNYARGEMRVKIAAAEFKNGVFMIRRVIPEGRREMSYGEFLRGFGKK